MKKLHFGRIKLTWMKLTLIGEVKENKFLATLFLFNYAKGLISATRPLLTSSTTRTIPADFHPFKIVQKF